MSAFLGIMAALDTVPDPSFAADRDPAINPLVLLALTVSFLATLFFTTAGIWLIDRYVLSLDDLQWTVLILIPWVFFILLLTTALVYQVIRGVLVSWRMFRK
jgi:hypothetical protein